MGKVTPPTLNNETVQQRLLTGASIKGGARGSLTRCATKFGLLTAKLKTSEKENNAEVEAIKEELKREVKLFRIEMHKWIVMVQSAEKELQQSFSWEQKIAANVEKKQQEIQELRAQAAKVARTRKNWQEYETLAKLARQRSPRRVLQAKMEKVNSDLEKTKKQLYETAAESKVREKQFHLLIQCMLDLKRSLGEAIEIPPEKKIEAEEEEEEEEEKEGKNNDKIEKEDGIEPMETEDADDLYGGL